MNSPKSQTFSQSSSPLTNAQILVIEDQAVTSMALAQELQRLGAKVTEVDSLSHARSLLELFSYDLILSNITINQENGCLFLQKWRSYECSQGRKMIPAIALPSEMSAYFESEILAFGFQRVIAKPFSFDEVTAIVCQMLTLSN